MALRMLFRGKTRLVARPSEAARGSIAALFREAREKEI
jgi:hypothetical protein